MKLNCEGEFKCLHFWSVSSPRLQQNMRKVRKTLVLTKITEKENDCEIHFTIFLYKKTKESHFIPIEVFIQNTAGSEKSI